MIKVLQVVGSLNYGGVESVIMNYYRHIDRSKIQFDFIVTTGGGRFEHEVRELGGKIFKVPSKSRHPFKYMRALRLIISENHYDIVHSNTNSASVYLDLKPAKRVGCKIRIAHSHNTSCLIKWQHYLLKPLLPSVVSHRFACSDEAAKWLFGKNKNYTIINNGIDSDKFAFDEKTRDCVRNERKWCDSFVIGNVASFQERKNQRFLIELLPALREKIQGVKLVLVGSGETVDELEELTCSLGLQDCVEFLGNRTDVSNLMQGFDVFAFPSKFEGLAVAYIEAIASGLQVIISDGVPVAVDGDRITRLPLEKDLWVNEIVSAHSVAIDRKFGKEDIIKAGYDIKTDAKNLENLYIGMVNGVEHK